MTEDNYTIINGIKCYNPELNDGNNFFNEKAFEELYTLEDKNFWFKSRNKLIQYLVKKYLNHNGEKAFFEIGCGTGYVLNGLRKFPKLKLFGGEIYIEGLKFASQRIPEAEFIQIDARNMPFVERFESIGVFDVLEHIDDDVKAIECIHKALKPCGYVFISVPQYMFMWSRIDDLSFHKRRYSRSEILGKLNRAGFKVEYVSSFVFVLFPLMYISRFLNRHRKESDSGPEFIVNEFRLNPLLNRLLYIFMLIDIVLIKLGFRLPAGGSLILAARKEQTKSK